VGYNPINGESYATKDGLNSKVEEVETTENEKESDETVQPPENVEQVENSHEKEATNGNVQEPIDHAENGNAQASAGKPTNGHTNGTNGHSTAKVRFQF
jgi:hypothetical protein